MSSKKESFTAEDAKDAAEDAMAFDTLHRHRVLRVTFASSAVKAFFFLTASPSHCKINFRAARRRSRP
jgi:hypothetical protein